MTTLKEIVHQVPDFISSDLAEQTAAQVKSHESKWIPQGSDPKHPYFYRLGAANYLDYELVDYKKNVETFNPTLQACFLPTYEKLRVYFSKRFNCEVVQPPELAWPGFHIYHKYAMPNGGRVHFDDFQHKWIKSNFYSDVDLESGLSFLIPVELTPGSGICFWNLTHSDYLKQHFDKQSLKGKQDHMIEYQIGCLYIFNSYYLHQIAPNNEPPSDKLRITLQGHLLKKNDGSMLMFW